ncbi:hypothetical protein GUJ93_ZPchr0012g22198 [Zizania palustris]|uniref:Uncharacterized protein n=1 Tax=Zizania palustris TaxID=103762 RepID=A0A8J5WR23_ZIZPA|nr:hypothetical protein GUJ93_ZPchr0012g22198 [Zizania palustris]
MGKDGAVEGVALDGEAVDEDCVGVDASAASEEDGVVAVVEEGLGALEIEEDGEGVGVAVPPVSEKDMAMTVVEEGLVAMEIEDGGEGVAAPLASKQDGVVPVVEEHLGTTEIEQDGEGLGAANRVGMAMGGGWACSAGCAKVPWSVVAVVEVFIAELHLLIRKVKRVYLGLYNVDEVATWTYDMEVRLVLGKVGFGPFPQHQHHHRVVSANGCLCPAVRP